MLRRVNINDAIDMLLHFNRLYEVTYLHNVIQFLIHISTLYGVIHILIHVNTLI